MSRNWAPNLKSQAALKARLDFGRNDGLNLPKAFIVLRYMIDGETIRWGAITKTYGGKGRAPINFQDGFGYDAPLKRMVRDGLATYNRGIHHEAALCYGGNPTINWSFLEVTDKGRSKYALMKKRYADKYRR